MPEHPYFSMATADKIVNVLIKHVHKEQMDAVMEDLQHVTGNATFRNVIETLTYAWNINSKTEKERRGKSR